MSQNRNLFLKDLQRCLPCLKIPLDDYFAIREEDRGSDPRSLGRKICFLAWFKGSCMRDLGKKALGRVEEVSSRRSIAEQLVSNQT